MQGNWPAIIYPSAAIAAVGLDSAFWRRLFRPALALGFGLTALVYVQATISPFPLPARIDPVTRLLRGWPGLADQIAALHDELLRIEGDMAPVVAPYLAMRQRAVSGTFSDLWPW